MLGGSEAEMGNVMVKLHEVFTNFPKVYRVMDLDAKVCS